jgi:hypothetical protein
VSDKDRIKMEIRKALDLAQKALAIQNQRKILDEEVMEMLKAGTGHTVIQEHIAAFYEKHGWELPTVPKAGIPQYYYDSYDNPERAYEADMRFKHGDE